MCPPDFPTAMETNINCQQNSAQRPTDASYQSPPMQPHAQRPHLPGLKKPRRSEKRTLKTRQILPTNTATVPPTHHGHVPAHAAPCAIVLQQIPMSDPSESQTAADTRKPRRI